MPRYDVVVIGAGLAGLTLVRQITLQSNKRVLLLERRPEVPPRKQKVGESLVQVGGYYLGKVLDLEESLFHNQLLKYNLRFYWKAPGRTGSAFEDFSQTYLRHFSNIPCYQLDRNTLEGELFASARASDRVEARLGVTDLDVALRDTGPHGVTFRDPRGEQRVEADWVVDASGRAAYLKGRLKLEQKNEVRHGASFFWVDGTVNVEKLTERPHREIRLNPDRRQTGHQPLWLATNHFMGEGFWFWVIPLRHKTSFGLVYDTRCVKHDEVSTPQRLLAWLNREFPLFARALEGKPIGDSGSYRDFSYHCTQTMGKNRWAITGEAGRFSDPLYSPGTDFIALHNTLITHAVTRLTPEEFESHQFLYELLLKSLYDAFLPSYDTSYDALGDQEVFSLKYTWELSVYFSFFVMPFVNELFTQQGFILPYLEKFAALGPLNKRIHEFLSRYYRWKKAQGRTNPGPIFHELSQAAPLREAESCFYQVGLGPAEALKVLDQQLDHLREMGRFIVAHVTALVAGDPALVTHRALVESIHPEGLVFDPEALKARCQNLPAALEPYPWKLDTRAFAAFWSPRVDTPSLKKTG